MCVNCKLEAMMEEVENPNPQEGRIYPFGWDLSGFFYPSGNPGVIGTMEDDTLRSVYSDPTLLAFHVTLAERFVMHPMEIFYDGHHYCYRPAIMKRNKPQPPAWHVTVDPDGPHEPTEDEERQAREDYAKLMEALGITDDGDDDDER